MHAVIRELRTRGYFDAEDGGSAATLTDALLDPALAESEQLATAVSVSAVLEIAFWRALWPKGAAHRAGLWR